MPALPPRWKHTPQASSLPRCCVRRARRCLNAQGKMSETSRSVLSHRHHHHAPFHRLRGHPGKHNSPRLPNHHRLGPVPHKHHSHRLLPSLRWPQRRRAQMGQEEDCNLDLHQSRQLLQWPQAPIQAQAQAVQMQEFRVD